MMPKKCSKCGSFRTDWIYNKSNENFIYNCDNCEHSWIEEDSTWQDHAAYGDRQGLPKGSLADEIRRKCEHSPGCPHWEKILANTCKFAEIVSKAQQDNPLFPGDH
jgi:hypothetical protein